MMTSCILFIGNARKKDKYKRMKQQEAKKELKKKAAKAGGKVTPFTGNTNLGQNIFRVL